MNDTDSTELPIFPTTTPEVFNDRKASSSLMGSVLAQLSSVVDISDEHLSSPTPCDSFNVAELRQHVLGWLQFFAAALNDPEGQSTRLNPDSWDLGAEQQPSEIVKQAALDINAAIEAGVADKLVVMAQARMNGGSVLAMAAGEYLVHGWDLATSTGNTNWNATDKASAPALEFLQSTVAPEYRGPESGFFDEEIPAFVGATDFEQLLCFAGRDPRR